MAAAMEVEPMEGIDSLEQKLQEIATGFQAIMDTSDTPDGRRPEDKKKGPALIALSNNFNLGCGMLAAMHNLDRRVVANHIASKTGSTIYDWYNEKVAMISYAMYKIIHGCKQQTRGGGKRRYLQKGGAMPDRYDVFTMILLGSSASLAVTNLADNGFFNSLSTAGLNNLLDASDYVINSVVDLSIKMGIFKAQCDSPSAIAWNLLKQYGAMSVEFFGPTIPVETCLDKIYYNETVMAKIQGAVVGALSVLSITLGSVTSYISAQVAREGVKAVYSAVKENISKPVVDAIVRRVCSLAKQRRDPAYERRASLRSATKDKQPEEQAIDEINEQIKNLVNSGAITPEKIIEQLKAQLNSGSVAESPAPAPAPAPATAAATAPAGPPPIAPPPSSLPLPTEPTAMDTTEGGRRRRKRATRKSRKVKKSKTMKRGRKGKSKRKAHKSKKSKKTRGRTSRARR